MARKPRVEIAGAFYHVIARGNNRQRIFKDSQDHRVYLKRLERYRERYGVTLYAYTLMPNHVHLLLETSTPPLSKFMQGLQQSYTVYFNRRHNHVGHLFQGRYRAILCERESYLVELIRYLHLNPVRAGLVRRPELYRWSSHHAYLGRPGEPQVATDILLAQFSSRRPTAVRRYARFVHEGLPHGHREDLYDVLDQRFLGTEQFAATAQRRAARSDHGEPLSRPRVTLDHCLRLVSRHRKLHTSAIRSNARSHDLVQARRLFICLACRYAGHPATEVGRFLGVDPSGVTNALRWWEQHLPTNPEIARDLEMVWQDVRN